MTAPADLQRLASAVSVSILVTVMVGSGGLTLLSRTDWWCEQVGTGATERHPQEQCR